MLQPVLIELHDARVDQILITLRAARVRFSHLVAYEPRSHDLYDVVGYDAELTIVDPDRMSLHQWIEGEAQVSMAMVDGRDAFAIEDTADLLSKGISARCLEVIFTNAARLEVAGRSLMIALGSQRTLLEEWRGPLVSSPG